MPSPGKTCIPNPGEPLPVIDDDTELDYLAWCKSGSNVAIVLTEHSERQHIPTTLYPSSGLSFKPGSLHFTVEIASKYILKLEVVFLQCNQNMFLKIMVVSVTTRTPYF